MTEPEKKALEAAGRLAVAVTEFLRSSDIEKRVAAFARMPKLLSDYDEAILSLSCPRK